MSKNSISSLYSNNRVTERYHYYCMVDRPITLLMAFPHDMLGNLMLNRKSNEAINYRYIGQTQKEVENFIQSIKKTLIFVSFLHYTSLRSEFYCMVRKARWEYFHTWLRMGK